MNELRDLVITVDGYSVDKTGFEMTEAHKENGDTWSLTVKAYKRKGEDFFSESNVSMLTLVDRKEEWFTLIVFVLVFVLALVQVLR